MLLNDFTDRIQAKFKQPGKLDLFLNPLNCLAPPCANQYQYLLGYRFVLDLAPGWLNCEWRRFSKSDILAQNPNCGNLKG